MAERDVWSPPAVRGAGERPTYVAVIGNTGAGKSTLVRALAGVLATQGDDVIGIDERSTHHPFLDRLFSDPRRYGFEMQLNFMLQRILIVRRWLDSGVSIVMERSHVDDAIFARHLLRTGLIDAAEHSVYQSLSKALAARAEIPDLIVCLDVEAQTSIDRLRISEDRGERPREFASEDQRYEWVGGWQREYRALFGELETDHRYTARLLRFDDAWRTDAIVDAVRAKLTAGER